MSGSTTKRFALSRASPADLPELVRLQYKCFPPFVRELFMGCRTEADLPRLVRYYERPMRQNPSDIWIKVTDRATDRIVAASNWRIHVNGGRADDDGDNEPPEWLEGEALERSRKIFRAFNAARREANPGGFVRRLPVPACNTFKREEATANIAGLDLHICFTDPDYRRQGAGGMMMQWGCDLANQLFLPAWVEASPEGNHLYRRHGFYDIGKSRAGGELQGTNMRRDARRTVIEGGEGGGPELVNSSE